MKTQSGHLLPSEITYTQIKTIKWRDESFAEGSAPEAYDIVLPLFSQQQQQQQQNHSAWQAQNNLDWSSRRGEIYLEKCPQKLRLLPRILSGTMFVWCIFLSYHFAPVWQGVNSGERAAGWRPGDKRSMCVFCCRSRGWFTRESSQVFTFNMIGASCATLHSNQETLWHFNSQGNEWKIHASKTIPYFFLFLMILINPIQSTIKLIECVTLCYSCPIKAKWIHKALLQQIRVISFFYLTYVMTYKIKRKYIYVFQLLSPFFTLYKNIVCACVCVCNELSMSINMVQWSLHKHKKKN